LKATDDNATHAHYKLLTHGYKLKLIAFPPQKLLKGRAYCYVTRTFPVLFTLLFSAWEGCRICCSLFWTIH